MKAQNICMPQFPSSLQDHREHMFLSSSLPPPHLSFPYTGGRHHFDTFKMITFFTCCLTYIWKNFPCLGLVSMYPLRAEEIISFFARSLAQHTHTFTPVQTTLACNSSPQHKRILGEFKNQLHTTLLFLYFLPLMPVQC